MSQVLPRLVAVCILALAACSSEEEFPQHAPEEFSVSTAFLARSCTVQNIRGQPLSGTFCGGSSRAFNCTPGAVYRCNTNSTTNNCTLSTACANGCVTNPDACFSGTNPFTLAATAQPGGADASATVRLLDSHPGGGIVNVRLDRGDLVAARFSCNVPSLAATQTQATFGMPTAVVSAPSVANIYADIAYTNASGVSRELVSPPIALTLQPGGSAPPTPAVTSFTLTPSTIAAGGVSFMDVTLERMAPIANVQVDATSSDPSIASIIAGGQPLVLGGCTTGGGAETVQAAKQVAATTTVDITASSRGSGQVPVSQPLTVNSGCSPRTCLDLAMPACSGPDGCGGTLSCGCSFGQVCGGGGTPGVCGDPGTNPTPASATLSGFTVSTPGATSGTPVTGSVTLSAAAPAGGAVVALATSGSAATVPPSVTIPAGSTGASFTIATNPVTTPTTVTLTGTYGASQSVTLTVNPAPASSSSTLTVTASGRSGVTISSNPAGIGVPVGSTGSASFATGTSITLSASSGRTAVWSGACATSRDTQTCTFTLTGAASVNANVK
jgi:hypothetical protein